MTRRGTVFACASLLVAVGFSLAAQVPAWLETGDRLDDAAFWRMVEDFSEPGGSFQSDNLVSNERTFPAILPGLARRRTPTSAYIGVGPEQNFSYIAAVRPRIAFVVDIRRQNAMLHLLYKALFERCYDRAEFLSRLLSRDRPRGLDGSTSVHDLFEAFANVPSRPDRFASNLKDVEKRLLRSHGFKLTEEDRHGLEYVYTAFFQSGPGLTYSSNSYRRGRPFPSFADLMTATDDMGVARSFLATEDNYQAVRELERRNLVVPVVGNFGGTKALKAVATYLHGRGLTATVFYTSNVEMYLFRSEDWQPFYENVAAMPRDAQSVLVRSVFGGFGFGYPPPDNTGAGRLGNLLLDPMDGLVASFRKGEITAYADVISRSR